MRRSHPPFSALFCLALLTAWLGPVLRAGAQTALDAFDPGAGAAIQAAAVQPDGKLVIGGSFLSVGGATRNYLARLNTDGTVDNSFDPGANGRIRAVAVQPDGKILVGGDFTLLGGGGTGVTPCSYVGRLLTNGVLDTTFTGGADGSVYCLFLQTNGQVLVGGQFLNLGGAPCNFIGRLKLDGTLDPTFTDPGVDTDVTCLGVQGDGKILVGGLFSQLGGALCAGCGRINADGTLDRILMPSTVGLSVRAMAVQPDGKLLLAGGFQDIGGPGRNYVARLNPEGTPDLTFINPVPELFLTALTLQPDGRILIGGDFLTLGGQPHSHIGRLNSDGSVDATFNASADAAIACLLVQPDFKIVVVGDFVALNGQPRGHIGRLNTDGSLESTLVPDLKGTAVYSLATQPDGKLLIAGSYTNLSGLTRSNLARLNLDGTVDNFNPAPNGVVRSLTVQPDGKLIVGGSFSLVAGATRTNLARLAQSGSLDNSFVGAIAGGSHMVYALAVQPDGKVLVGGDFLTLNGQTHNHLGRVNPDGNVDTGFNAVVDGPVYAMALQPDGAVLLGGAFHNLGGLARSVLGRLNTNGTLDATFNAALLLNSGTLSVQALALQADGKILVGGNFTLLNGQACTNLGRLNPSGSSDLSFNPGVNGPVQTLALQADGRIIVGGWFNLVHGLGRNRLARLNADGAVDSGFDASAGINNYIYTLAIQADGKIDVGGLFDNLAGQPRKGFGRITSGAAALQTLILTAEGRTVVWSRAGAEPEIQQALLEESWDGVTYTRAMAGTRVNGGWQFPNWGPFVGGNFYVRVRGRCSDGVGSSGLVESVFRFYDPPVYLTGAGRLINRSFQFVFDAASGGAMTVLASADASLPSSSWTPLGSPIELSTGHYQFIDAQAPLYPRRFYRVRSP